MVQAVLFDLDGTLTDSAPVVTRIFADTMKALRGLDWPANNYRKYVGPPLQESFRELGATDADVNDYVNEYRQRYAVVGHETRLFDGVAELLTQVRAEGLALALATSKFQRAAKSVCEHLGIADHFDALCGDTTEKNLFGKAEVVGMALDELTAMGILSASDVPRTGEFRDDVVMVGDRIYDIEGAGKHGVRTILVGWSDVWPEEQERAWATVADPQELLELLRRLKNEGFSAER